MEMQVARPAPRPVPGMEFPVKVSVSALVRRVRGGAIAAAVALACLMAGSPPALAAKVTDASFIQMRRATAAPSGFSGVCSRYAWACSSGGSARASDADVLALAQKVNRQVNSAVHEVSDRNQYGVEEYWALPSGRGGDCEDFALMKKMVLMKQGVPASQLMIATVLDRHRAPHAVLVLRTGSGDLVLDNLRGQIRSWQDTGYSFLRIQDPKSPKVWHAVLAGGIFAGNSL